MRVLLQNSGRGRQRLAKTMQMKAVWHKVVDVVNSILDGRTDSIVDIEVDASVTTSGAEAGSYKDPRITPETMAFLSTTGTDSRYIVEVLDGEIKVKRR